MVGEMIDAVMNWLHDHPVAILVMTVLTIVLPIVALAFFRRHWVKRDC